MTKALALMLSLVLPQRSYLDAYSCRVYGALNETPLMVVSTDQDLGDTTSMHSMSKQAEREQAWQSASKQTEREQAGKA